MSDIDYTNARVKFSRTVYVAITNTDNNEGRGNNIALAISTTESTALRLGKRGYIQGSDCPVATYDLVKIDNVEYIKSSLFSIQRPSVEDNAADIELCRKRELIHKMVSCGMTNDEVKEVLDMKR